MAPSTPPTSKPGKSLEQYALDVISSPFGGDSNANGSAPSTSVKNLSALLISHGFISRPFSLSTLDEAEIERIVRCFWAVLGARADALSSLSTLTSAHQVLNYDLSRSQTLLHQSLEQQAHLESEFEALKSKVDKVQKELNQESASHKTTREELNKSRSALQYVKTQTSLTVRRHELLSASIAQKFQQLSSLSPAAPTTVRILNPSVSNGFPSAPSGGSAETELLEESLRDAEARAARERMENSNLRNLLKEVRDWSVNVRRGDFEIEDLLLDPDTEDIENLPAETVAMKVHQELFHLRELVVEILREKKEKFKVLEAGFGEKEKEWEARREELEAELRDIKDQLEKANEMVEAFISAESLHGHPALANGLPNGKDHDLGDETTDGIEDEMVRQRRLLEEERQKFTEAAVRLGKERGEFEAERIAFYEERRKLQVQLMLSDLPETPLSAKAPAPAEEGTKPSRRVSIASPLIAKRAKSPPPIAVPKTTNSRLKNILAMATDSQDVPTLPDSPEPIPTKEKAKEKVKEKEKEKEKARRPTITSKPSASSTHTTTVVQSRRVGSTSAATSPPPVRKSTSPVAPAEKLSKPLDKGPTKPLVLSSGEERKGLQMRKRSNSTSAPPTREITNPIRSRKVSVGPGVSVREKETANGASKIAGLKRSSSMKVSTSTTSAAAPEKAKEGTRSRKDSTHARAATVSSSTVPKKVGEEKNATETRARKTSTVGRSASTSISLKTEKDKEREKEKEKRSVSGTVSASERVRALVKKATEKSG